MYSLAFDTTGAGCSIVLRHNDVVLSKFEKFTEFGQAEILLPQIKKMLADSAVAFNELDALFVCVGPGSFTGVRSGIAAARAFAFASPALKVGGISAFDAYAQTFEEEDIAEINAVIIETRRDDFYVQLFDRHLEKKSEPQALMREDIIPQLKGRLVSLAGDGVERFLSSPSGLCLHAIKMYDFLPSEALLKAGLKALSAKKLNFPKPLYLRAPDVSLPKNS